MYDSFSEFMRDRALARFAKPPVVDGTETQLFAGQLTSVPPLQQAMLPDIVGDYVWDVAERQGAPCEFIAVSLLVAYGAVLGNAVAIAPRARHDWAVFPTNWAMLIGEPSAMKTPSMRAGLMPLEALQRQLDDTYDLEAADLAAMRELGRMHTAEIKAQAREALRQGDLQEAYRLLQQCVTQVSAPRPRLMVEDISEAKLVQVLADNPHGVLGVHDELTGLLSRLTKRSGTSERALLIKAWTGDTPHSYDRAGRDRIEVKRLTLSLLGGFQPARLIAVVKDAQGEGADGLLSRFQLSVWPDPVRDRSPVDRAPDQHAAERIRALFERTHSAIRSRPASQPLRFDPEAQHHFDRWSGPWLQAAAARPAALQSHFVKMQRTVAGLSLVFEYMMGPSESVSVQAVDMALSWAPFLSSHAERIHSISNTSLPAASAILARRTALPHRFTARDIYRADWSGLGRAATEAGLADLVARGQLRCETISTGGRPSRQYFWVDQ